MEERQEEERVMVEQRVRDEEANSSEGGVPSASSTDDTNISYPGVEGGMEFELDHADDDESVTETTLPPTTTATGTTSKSTKVKYATDLLWVRKRRALDVATADRKSPPELGHQFKTIPANPELANKSIVIAKKLLETNTPIRRSVKLSNKEGLPCTAPSDEDDEDEDYDDRDDDEDHEDDEDYEGRDDTTNVNNSFNDTDINGDDPVAEELGPNDIMYGVHHSQMYNHQGNMSARELALLHYQEYSETNSRTFKSTLVASLIKRLENEGRKFLLKTKDGWRTMSYEEKHIRFSQMICNLNKRPNVERVKVKPKKPVVKKSKLKWDEKDGKTLREYITESDVDNEFKWGSIAKKLNRTIVACQKRMRMILDCGIYGEEKTGEHIDLCIVTTSRLITSSVVCFAH
jgi:hypothetical protein